MVAELQFLLVSLSTVYRSLGTMAVQRIDGVTGKNRALQ